MKIKNLNLFVLLAFTISIPSCVSVKAYEKSYADEIKLGLDPDSKVFIKKKDGKKIEGKEITFSHESIWRVKQKENWIAIDGQKINMKDISSFENQNGYFAFYKYDRFLESQPYQFVSRVRQGKLNLYYYTFNYSGQIQGKDHNVYIFQKGKGKLQDFKFSEFYDAIKDNIKAVQKLNTVFPKGKIPFNDNIKDLRKLASVVDVYNS